MLMPHALSFMFSLVLACTVQGKHNIAGLPAIHKPISPSQISGAKDGHADISQHLVHDAVPSAASMELVTLLQDFDRLEHDILTSLEIGNDQQKDGVVSFCKACYNKAKDKVAKLVDTAPPAAKNLATGIVHAGKVSASAVGSVASWTSANAKAAITAVFGGNKYFAWKAVAGMTLFVLGIACTACAAGILVASVIFAVGTAAMEGYWAKQKCEADKADKNGVNCYAQGMGVFLFNGVKGGLMIASGAHLADAIGVAAGQVNNLAGMIDWACTTAIDFEGTIPAELDCDSESEGCGVPGITLNPSALTTLQAASSMSLADLEKDGLEREAALKAASEFLTKGGSFVYGTTEQVAGETVTYATCVKQALVGNMEGEEGTVEANAAEPKGEEKKEKIKKGTAATHAHKKKVMRETKKKVKRETDDEDDEE